jgi:hypothetical protein
LFYRKYGGKVMADATKKPAEQTRTTQAPGIEAPASGTKSDRDELMEASQQFFRTLLRTGVHLAMTPVTMLPEEPREHFVTAGREFTRGLATLANELANVFEKMVSEAKEQRDAATRGTPAPTDAPRTND